MLEIRLTVVLPFDYLEIIFSESDHSATAS